MTARMTTSLEDDEDDEEALGQQLGNDNENELRHLLLPLPLPLLLLLHSPFHDIHE
jgi:hypothetical protein